MLQLTNCIVLQTSTPPLAEPTLRPLVQNPLEGFKVAIFVKNRVSLISRVERIVKMFSNIATWGS